MEIITYDIIHTTIDTNKVEGNKDKSQETELGDKLKNCCNLYI